MSLFERYLATVVACAVIYAAIRKPVHRWYKKGYPAWFWVIAFDKSEEEKRREKEKLRIALSDHQKRVWRHRIAKTLQALLCVALFGAGLFIVFDRIG